MVEEPPAVVAERQRRLDLRDRLRDAGGPDGVLPGILRKLGLYGGAQGVWVDKATTGGLGPYGVTVGLLHTGRSYADDLGLDDLLYHYPSTRRPAGRDRAEVEATKDAGRLRLPVFVITQSEQSRPTRDVRLGWVEDWDDDVAVFLVGFGDWLGEPGPGRGGPEEPFRLTASGARRRRPAEVVARPGQQRFKFRVLKRYGPRCAVCDRDVLDVLDAAHLVPVAEGGPDHPGNGLVLCATHHRAFDAGLFAIEPRSLRIVPGPGADAGRLGITRGSLGHLDAPPHEEALRWAWERR